ncbi:hypothetical protein DM860_004878 [Cuscuta australis]|uniref:Neoxanthin synthase n=1 Tax=Cuscuta australis TaxID=267555 RepID=A0A328DQI3_9ASTE|nr:hypothetical protein DM860_004878 [Cuscuta australis]
MAAASSCFALPSIFNPHRLHYPSLASKGSQNSVLAAATANHRLFYQRIKKDRRGGNLRNKFSFLGASFQLNIGRKSMHKRNLAVSASLLPASQVASSAFTWGTVAILPFYAFMVVAPKSAWTQKMMKSGTPFVALGVLYGYLLYLSWTPNTLCLMFASKYWLPELSGIIQMFSNEMTMASAWIHLLAVDLYAAKQVYEDGMQNDVEIRHSVSLCLLFCPIGILVHLATKAVSSMKKGKRTVQ